MENILDRSLNELQKEFSKLSLHSFRAKQVFTWLHKKLKFDFELMTDLPNDLRLLLKEKYYIKLPRVKSFVKSKDGTKKFLFAMEDGDPAESVLLQDETKRKTICLSSQAGCPLNCSFCATGKMGFKRNLSVSEIIGQVYRIAERSSDISNLVFMGMGEPFLNYDNVLKSLQILMTKEGANFGQRKITVSTCGIPHAIKKFAQEDLQVRLAISLNAADDNVRSQLMPINRKYPIPLLMEAVKYYLKATGRRITFEYVMLEGVNDRRADLEKLKELCQGLDVYVNLIPFNPFGTKYKASPQTTLDFFVKALCSKKINAAARGSKGIDILAACGQLAEKV